jgi:methyl-accepting chemotaxis protein
MTETVERVRGLAGEIGRATGEQSQGGAQIMAAVETMRDIATMVSHAAAEQSRGSSQIREAVERAGGMIETISRAVGEQARGAGVIAERAESLQARARETLESAESVRVEGAALREQAAAVESDLQRFKT